MKVQDININDRYPVKNKAVDKLPVKMEGLFIAPKASPINIMCEKCTKRQLELKQQATKLFVMHFLQNRTGEISDTRAMRHTIKQEFEESERKFDDLLASLSDISCINNLTEQDANDASLKTPSNNISPSVPLSNHISQSVPLSGQIAENKPSSSKGSRNGTWNPPASSQGSSHAPSYLFRPPDRTVNGTATAQDISSQTLVADYHVRKSRSSELGNGFHSASQASSQRSTASSSRSGQSSGRNSGYQSGPDSRRSKDRHQAGADSRTPGKNEHKSCPDSRRSSNSRADSVATSKTASTSSFRPLAPSKMTYEYSAEQSRSRDHSAEPSSSRESSAEPTTSQGSSSRDSYESPSLARTYKAEPARRQSTRPRTSDPAHQSRDPKQLHDPSGDPNQSRDPIQSLDPSQVRDPKHQSRDPIQSLDPSQARDPKHQSRDPRYPSSDSHSSTSNNISETDSNSQRVLAETRGEVGSYSPSSYESLARDHQEYRSRGRAYNPYKEGGTWPRHSSPFAPVPVKVDGAVQVATASSHDYDSSNSANSNNYSSPTSPHLTSPPPSSSDEQTGFYKGRVLEKLAVPPQTSLEWVNGTRHGNGTTNGHCTDCETTEQQLKIGAVNTVRDHETRLTNALKSVKSQRVASGYRSDSVLGLGAEHKKRNQRSPGDKISNLHHKSTENLKCNYVELASFGPPPPKPAVKAFNGTPGSKPTTNGNYNTTGNSGSLGNGGSHGNSSHGNCSNGINTAGIIDNGTARSEPAYVNLATNTQNASMNTPPPPSASPNTATSRVTVPQLPTSHPISQDTAPNEAVKIASSGIVPWHGAEPSVPPTSLDIPNSSVTDLAPVPPKRTDSSRFSSRLKRRKDSKGTPTSTPTSTPLSTPDPNKVMAPNNGFFNKASQMFRKRKKERPLTYAELMRLFAPPPPQALLRAQHTEAARSSDNYAYNVKVGMRISPNTQNKESILSVDEDKSTVLIANENLFFDYVHGPQSKQIDMCSSMLSDVLPAILHGRSVVVVTFGKDSPGRQYSLIGSRDATQSLGLVPTAVTWLNKLGEDDRSKCGPNTVHVASLRLNEQKCLSEFVSPAVISKSDDLGKYLDKLTLTLPAREHPNDEALIINMTFSKSKSKKKNKDKFGMLTFIDIGTPIRKNDSSNVLCWQWLQDVTQNSGSKYFETFVQLRHELMHSKTHIACIGHITHSPKDYQAIGITLNLATRLYMRHLPAHKRNELQRLKREKDYSSATSTGEESADTVIYRPGLSSDGEAPPKSYLPERTKGDGQEKSPQFTSCNNKRPAGGARNLSDTEDRVKGPVGAGSRNLSDTEDRVKSRQRTGYHSDTVHANSRRGAGYSSDSGNYKPTASQGSSRQPPPQTSRQPTRTRQYALTDSEDVGRSSSAAPRGSRPAPKQFSSDTENQAGVNAESAKRRTASKSAINAEDTRQKRVQKNQQQLKRYFELLRLKNQREAILAQSREMRADGSTPEVPSLEEDGAAAAWSAENPTKAPLEEAAKDTITEEQSGEAEETAEGEDKENEEVTLRNRARADSRNKGDNRRLYTIYDTEDDGAVLDKLAEENKARKIKSGYKSDGGVKTSEEKTEISKEWLQKIKKKRQVAPGGKFIDYGPIDLKETPQIREVKTKRVKSSLSEDELLTRRNTKSSSDLTNRNHRYSERRLDKRSGYSTDAPSSGAPAAPVRSKSRGSSGYQSDGPSHRNRHNRQTSENKQSADKPRPGTCDMEQDVELEQLLEQVQEVEQLVQNKMQWRGAVQDLDYFDQQIRILERRNSLIEKLRRKQFDLLSELQATKINLMSSDWKPDLTVDSAMNENAPGYLSALWTETSNLEIRVNTCKSKILVETSFM